MKWITADFRGFIWRDYMDEKDRKIASVIKEEQSGKAWFLTFDENQRVKTESERKIGGTINEMMQIIEKKFGGIEAENNETT